MYSFQFTCSSTCASQQQSVGQSAPVNISRHQSTPVGRSVSRSASVSAERTLSQYQSTTVNPSQPQSTPVNTSQSVNMGESQTNSHHRTGQHHAQSLLPPPLYQ
eukprot:3421286-Pyramimonas_sp.AAC.1